MPAWTNSPFAAIRELIPGVPEYSAGTPPASSTIVLGAITQAGITSNVATVEYHKQEGNVPAVGDLVYIRGASSSFYNVAGVAITGVTDTSSTLARVTFALVHGDDTFAAASGQIEIVPQPAGETLTANQAYQAFAMPAPSAPGANRSITLNVQYPSAPSTISWAVQAAIDNIESEYVTIFNGADDGTYTDSGAAAGTGQGTQFWPGAFRFIRFKDTGSSGGSSPTVIAKLLVA